VKSKVRWGLWRTCWL